MGLEERIDNLIRTLEKLKARADRIEREIYELQKELMRLSPQRGWVEWRWVKNKIGKKYWYYYYCYWENGKKRSVYLGKRIPSSLLQGFKDRARAKAIIRRIRELHGEKIAIEKAVEKAEYTLFSI